MFPLFDRVLGNTSDVCFRFVFSSGFPSLPPDNDWNDVVLATVGEPVTLTCVDWSVRGTVKINWMVKSPGVDQWKLVLSANERKEFSGGSSKTSMRLADPNFADTGNFSLHFVPQMQDVGRYSCLIQGQKKTLKQRIILLAVLTGT